MAALGRIRVAPRTFDVRDWNCVESTPQSIAFRPSGRTLLRRLGGTLLAAIVIGMCSALMFEAYNKRAVPEGDVVFQVYLAVCGVVSVLGILAPLSVLWDRVSIVVDGRNRIAVIARGIRTKTCGATIDQSTRLGVRAVEHIRRRRHAGISHLGYRWIVSIEPSPSIELIGTTVTSIDFVVHWQKDRPVEEMPLPPRVRAFVDAIGRMTGLLAAPHTISDYAGVESLWGRRRYRVSGHSGPIVETRTMIGAPVVSSHTVGFDEMSPEMRAQFEAFRARAGAGGTETVTAEFVSDGGGIAYRGADGTVHTYRSVDDMPPEVRAMLDMMRNATRGVRDDT
ncbi:MAG: hypothetical protein FJY92_07130 [Candidatus Hydrogenedentes bacterium]|nr:hypothetical protein [Candidatus Hydrogenedentota bacterium]